MQLIRQLKGYVDSRATLLVRSLFLLCGASCVRGDAVEPLSGIEIRLVAPTSVDHYGSGTVRPLPRKVLVDTAGATRGPLIYGIVDAAQWQDSFLVLDRHGLIWVVPPEMRSVHRVLSVGQAVGRPLGRPLSVVADESGFGTWDVGSGSVMWFSRGGILEVRRSPAVSLEDLFTSGFRPLEPPRMHGRLVRSDGDHYLELRRGDQQTEGASVDAALVRLRGRGTDTLLSFRAPSNAEFRAGMWICCGRPRIFAPQPWWAPLSDGRLVFTDGRTPELVMYSDRGTVLRRVTWEVDPRVRRSSRQGVIEYLSEDTRREFAHASPNYIRSLNGRIPGRVDRFPGAFSDTVPLVTQLVVDDEDRVWVRRFDRSRWPEGLSSTWDIFDSAFTYLGHVHLPMLDYVFEIEDGKILGTQVVHGALQRLVLVPLQGQSIAGT